MNQIKYLNKAKVINEDNRKYIVKNRKIDISSLYAKLSNRGFTNFLKPEEVNESLEKYKYIDQLSIPDAQKAKDIVYLTSILHNKTTQFDESIIDDTKEIYENVIEKLDNIYKYYTSLQDEIEEHIYMSPAEMLLMNNISNIYLMLNLSRENIERFYKLSENKTKRRRVLLHGNLSLDHILEADERYLISWNKSRIDIPVYDLTNFYKKDFERLEIESLYEEYQNKYKYTEEERALFFSLINIPEVINLNHNNYINTVNVRHLINYLDKTINFTLKENKEDQESND